jgi:hypothetical protein
MGVELVMGWVLMVIGVGHLAILPLTGAEWEGALSARKPGLFGVSLGVTCWSLVWLAGKLGLAGWERWVVRGMVWSLVLEMGLISMQYWRGRPSHFNSGAPFDRLVEGSMLVLILGFMVGLAWMCLRVRRVEGGRPEMRLAMRWGVWLLMVSCLLGGATTFVGKANVAAGRAPEIYGQAGVLKYPHGVVLHALQVLPVLGWVMWRAGARRRELLMWAAVGAHLLLLVYAVRQTFTGRGRFDVDGVGVMLLGAAGVLVGMIVVELVRAMVWGRDGRVSC